MKHPFSVLRQEYVSLLETVKVTRSALANEVARRRLSHKSRYVSVGDQTRVPVVMLMALHGRESDGDFRTYLGNGQPLDRVTTIVPKGRGPWLEPSAWEKGAIDAINYDHLNDATAPWDMAYACWKGEAWNGFGPRNHGIHTGYLWAGTNHYTRGKYVADGVWDAEHVDTQLGVIPVMLALVSLDPSLALPMPTHAIATSPPLVPMPTPVGVGSLNGVDRTRWIQEFLNKRAQADIAVDGSYGRKTREAVRAWQIKNGVQPFDGLAGPVTIRAMEAAETR